MLPLFEAHSPFRKPTPRITPVVLIFVLTNLVLFLAELSVLQIGDASWILSYSLIPKELTHTDVWHGVLTLFTSMFLHGSWMHVLGNVWFLWVFGRSIEIGLGSVRCVALYLLSGVFAALTHVVMNPLSSTPMLGASGAISGILGAYVSLFPWRRIHTLVPILIVPIFLQIPAVVLILEWFLLNLLNGALSMQMRDTSIGGVAWWAHLGGFFAGLIFVRILFPSLRNHPNQDAHTIRIVQKPSSRRY